MLGCRPQTTGDATRILGGAADEVLYSEGPDRGDTMSESWTFVDGIQYKVNWWSAFLFKHVFQAFKKRIFVGLS